MPENMEIDFPDYDKSSSSIGSAVLSCSSKLSLVSFFFFLALLVYKPFNTLKQIIFCLNHIIFSTMKPDQNIWPVKFLIVSIPITYYITSKLLLKSREKIERLTSYNHWKVLWLMYVQEQLERVLVQSQNLCVRRRQLKKNYLVKFT